MEYNPNLIDTVRPVQVFPDKPSAEKMQHYYARSLVRKGLAPRVRVAVRRTRGGKWGIYLVQD